MSGRLELAARWPQIRELASQILGQITETRVLWADRMNDDGKRKRGGGKERERERG